MKKMLAFTAALLLCFAAGRAQTESGWDNWQQTSCYSKISFRMKYVGKHGSQHHWQIQLRNDYEDLVSFNYNITDKIQEYSITTHRKTLYGNKVSDVIDVYTKEEDIYLLVDKLSLSPYPENFMDCDKKEDK
ncbi:hypothetical protein [Flavobacterium sp.]|uniref:hypothetical protein n=1 Tax=Flavobacterium sp. TaxID=239 RepID=UPI002609FA33|nr:hypothetical protein [Flavobacterium sp.]